MTPEDWPDFERERMLARAAKFSLPDLQSQDDLECSEYGRKAPPGILIVYALGALIVVFALAVWIVL